MAASPGKPSAAELAYRAIRDGILDGTTEPGSMLGELPLATSLGISRTPVRAALVRLQEEGWITIYPKRGALVHGLTHKQIAQLADARFILESTAVQRADVQSLRVLTGELEESLEAQGEALEARDLGRFIDLTLDFHRAFVRVSGNEVLLELYGRLADRHRFVLFQEGKQILERSAEIRGEHQRLVAHLRAGDIPGFARALNEHIADSGGLVHFAASTAGL